MHTYLGDGQVYVLSDSTTVHLHTFFVHSGSDVPDKITLMIIIYGLKSVNHASSTFA